MFENDLGLRIGTSSWSSKDWLGVFYPPGTPPNRFIEHYATVYDTVEIDATFYGIPSETNVQAWRRRTPEGFLFAAKVPRIITHEKILMETHDDMHLFLEVISHLGDRLGPLLLQFPYFNKGVFASKEPFLERLDNFLAQLPTDFRYVVEIRNRFWLGADIQRICQQHRVALAWAEQGWMPRPSEWRRRLGGPSTDFAYVRWLGDHKAMEQKTQTWDRTVIDRSRELAEWVAIIRELRYANVDVFGYFNNHFSGHAPAAVELFREAWSSAFRDRE